MEWGIFLGTLVRLKMSWQKIRELASGSGLWPMVCAKFPKKSGDTGDTSVFHPSSYFLAYTSQVGRKGYIGHFYYIKNKEIRACVEEYGENASLTVLVSLLACVSQKKEDAMCPRQFHKRPRSVPAACRRARKSASGGDAYARRVNLKQRLLSPPRIFTTSQPSCSMFLALRVIA